MRAGNRSTERSSRYTPVPQAAVSDEDEGVYDESPESSQHAELLPSEQQPSGAQQHQQQPPLSIRPHSPSSSAAAAAAESLRPLDPHLAAATGARRYQRHHALLRHALSPVALSGASASSASFHVRPEKMSCQRWACFSVSLGLCVGYILALLWLIPCQWAPCLQRGRLAPLIRLQSWNTTLPFVNFVSEPWPVSVGPADYTVVLLAFHLTDTSDAELGFDLAVRPSSSSSSGNINNNGTGSGVVALRGDTGREVWRQTFHTTVVDLACDVVDVNGDGVAECTVVGRQGLMAAVNASNGYTFWYLHDHDDQSVRIASLSSPLPLPHLDLDKDGVSDLAILALLSPPGVATTISTVATPAEVTAATRRRRRRRRHIRRDSSDSEDRPLVHLLLVSGATGQIIGRALALPMLLAPDPLTGPTTVSPMSSPLLFDLGNRSAALLLLSGGTGTPLVAGGSTNPETILLAALEDVYSEATREWATGDQEERGRSGASVWPEGTLLKEIYRAEGKIESIQVVPGGPDRAGDVLVLEENGQRLLCLDGNAGFATRWRFKESEHLVSHFVIGHYNEDSTLDIFFLLRPVNCSAPSKCQTKAIVLDGMDGKLLASLTSEFADAPFSPLLLRAEEATNATDVFMFRTAAPTGQRVDLQVASVNATAIKSTSAPTANTESGVTDHLSSGTQYGNAETRINSAENAAATSWADIRDYVGNVGSSTGTATQHQRPASNDTTLYRVEQLWGGRAADGSTITTSSPPPLPQPMAQAAADGLKPDVTTSGSSGIRQESLHLVAFQKDGQASPWEVDLGRTVAECGPVQDRRSSKYYTAVPSNSVGNPFLIAAVNCVASNSGLVTSVDLGKTIPHTHRKRAEEFPNSPAVTAFLHPTTD